MYEGNKCFKAWFVVSKAFKGQKVKNNKPTPGFNHLVSTWAQAVNQWVLIQPKWHDIICTDVEWLEGPYTT